MSRSRSRSWCIWLSNRDLSGRGILAAVRVGEVHLDVSDIAWLSILTRNHDQRAVLTHGHVPASWNSAHVNVARGALRQLARLQRDLNLVIRLDVGVKVLRLILVRILTLTIVRRLLNLDD